MVGEFGSNLNLETGRSSSLQSRTEWTPLPEVCKERVSSIKTQRVGSDEPSNCVARPQVLVFFQ